MPKEIPNNYRENPIKYYMNELSTKTSSEVAQRCGLKEYDGKVVLTFLGVQYEIAIPSFEWKALTEDRLSYMSDQAVQILILHFLNEGAKDTFGHTFLSYSELPWGDVYLRQFTGRCINRLAGSYGSRIDAFCKACEALGGEKLPQGDASYDIPYLNDTVIRLIIWGPDEDFPASAQILFSDNCPAAFTAEDCACLCDILITAMKRVLK